MSSSELIQEFRELGGTFENIRIGQGNRGRGLFAIDPGKPVTIHVPENLLVPREEVEFRDGNLRVQAHSRLTGRPREFFEAYAREVSWGQSRPHCESYVEALQSLPETLRIELGTQFGMPMCLQVPAEKWPQRHFLNTRSIHYEPWGLSVLMPFLELANHGPFGAFAMEPGIGLDGLFPDEVLVSYREGDAWEFFSNWGFIEPADRAYSRRTEFETPGCKLLVKRQWRYGSALQVENLGALWIPTLTREEERWTLSFAVLGNRQAPRTPRAVFTKLLREAGLDGTGEIFEQVRRANILSFLELVDLLEGVPGQVAATMRRALSHQLKTLAECFGTRAL